MTLTLLSSSVLASVWTPASAQEIPPMGPTTPIAAAGTEPGNSNTPIGTVPQPTTANPGWVVGVSLGELYTDNLKLAPSGKPKQSSLITQIQPFIKAAYSSPRFSGVVDYTLTGYLYAGHSSYNQLSQNLKAQGTLTILQQHLFVDSTALYGSEVIDARSSAGSGGTFYLSNNRANVARASISPYWIQDLGNVGTLNLRYSYGRVVYNTKGISGRNGGSENDDVLSGITPYDFKGVSERDRGSESSDVLSGIPDISSNAVRFSLVSPKYKSWGWNVQYSDQRIEPDFGRSIEYATARIGTHVEVSEHVRLLADGGRESNFLPDGTVDKLGASFWDAGFAWSNNLYHLKATIGHRFYGRSYQFSLSRTAARLRTTISYVEQPTDINQQLLGQNPGQIITAPNGVSNFSSLRERQPYLMKRAAASAQYEMPKGSLRVTLYDEKRTYFTLDNQQEKVANANIDWRFRIGPFTTLTPTVGWQRYQFRDGEVRYNNYEQLALVHQFNPKNFGSLRLRHDSSNANSALTGARGYRANVIFVQWTHLF